MHDGFVSKENYHVTNYKFGIVFSRYNKLLCEKMLNDCLDCLKQKKVSRKDIFTFDVPGALEIPYILKKLCKSKSFDVLIALGCVIRGETYHFELVCHESFKGVYRIQDEYDIPIINGILTCENQKQAQVRSKIKGTECALAAIEMALLSKKNFKDGYFEA